MRYVTESSSSSWNFYTVRQRSAEQNSSFPKIQDGKTQRRNICFVRGARSFYILLPQPNSAVITYTWLGSGNSPVSSAQGGNITSPNPNSAGVCAAAAPHLGARCHGDNGEVPQLQQLCGGQFRQTGPRPHVVQVHTTGEQLQQLMDGRVLLLLLQLPVTAQTY